MCFFSFFSFSLEQFYPSTGCGSGMLEHHPATWIDLDLLQVQKNLHKIVVKMNQSPFSHSFIFNQTLNHQAGLTFSNPLSHLPISSNDFDEPVKTPVYGGVFSVPFRINSCRFGFKSLLKKINNRLSVNGISRVFLFDRQKYFRSLITILMRSCSPPLSQHRALTSLTSEQ